MNQVLNKKMSANEIQEKCPNLLKTAKNQTIYHIEECCWGTDWQIKFKEGFSFYSSQSARSQIATGVINIGDRFETTPSPTLEICHQYFEIA